MKLAVVHFMPLEYYPPVTNFLTFIAEKSNITAKVWSCGNIKKREEYQNRKISITRNAFPDVKEFAIIRLMKYWIFNINTLIGLVIFRPDRLLYYESFSVWPVYFYLKYFNNAAQLFIHFHEYSSPEWYAEGMRLVKHYHKLEKKYLFNKASWISQTNKIRAELFYNDHNTIYKNKIFILPNYPPKGWQISRNRKIVKNQGVQKLVYIGSLSLKDTFIKEICYWVFDKKGKVQLDIYSYNIHDDTRNFLNRLNDQNITFHNQGIEYDLIPRELQKYDVGLILYKANSVNYRYNETNKLFEYLACGLDVWFPNVMEGTKFYICRDSYPMILDINFENLNQYQNDELVGDANLPTRAINYYCDLEYEKLHKALVGEG